MTRIQMWASYNLGVLGLVVVLAALALIAGQPPWAFGAGVIHWLLLLGVLLFVRRRKGQIVSALDERELAVFRGSWLWGFSACLLGMLVFGAGAVAAGGDVSGVSIGLFLIFTPLLAVAACSVYVLIQMARDQ